jgi:hypothetical protein
VAVLGLAAAVLTACAAGARLEDGAFVVPDKGYRVTGPAGWDRIESEADLALRARSGEAGLLAHATCDGAPPRRPLAILSRHLRFGLRDVQVIDEGPVELAGRSAQQTRFSARLDAVSVIVWAVMLRAGPCVYDLALVAAPSRAAAVEADFARFRESFQLLAARP